MKNNYFKWSLLVGLSLATFVSKAQLTCGSDQYLKAMKAEDPSIAQRQAEMEKRLQKRMNEFNFKVDSTDTTTVVIPIVFHIVHQYGPENISDAQILSAVRILNEDFNAENKDTNTVIAPFKNKIGNAHVRFELATIDPAGNCTNGIERIPSLETYYVNKELNRGRFGIWDHTRYLNIWVTNKLPDGAAGISTFPFSANSQYSKHDGISMLANYTGDIGTSGPGGARALTHEVGHFLNLFHIWGNTEAGTECGDDGVWDTPITTGFQPNSVPCYQEIKDCDTVNNAIAENQQNYMDYAYCQQMYTKGQCVRMRNALFNDSLGYRWNLYTPQTHTSTGIHGHEQVCAPIADFYGDKKIACKNTPVSFRDNTTRNFVQTRSWTFQDGNPATSTAESPTVRFTTSGWKTVTLTVTGSGGTDTKTIDKAVFVSADDIAFGAPYAETFATSDAVGNFWISRNYEDNQTSFKQTNAAGYWDNTSAVLNAAKSAGGRTLVDGAGDIDELYTPAFNLAGKDGWFISFKLSAATKTTISSLMTDSMIFESSFTCGTSWQLVKSYAKTKLYTAGFHAEDFVPAGKQDWQDIVIPITAAMAKDNMRFRFKYLSGTKSNNIYIDEFQIVQASSIKDEFSNKLNVSLYPNPVTQESVVNFYLPNTSEVSMTITDITGKMIATDNLGTVTEGEQTLNIGKLTNELTSGIYFINLNVAGTVVTKKLIVD